MLAPLRRRIVAAFDRVLTHRFEEHRNEVQRRLDASSDRIEARLDALALDLAGRDATQADLDPASPAAGAASVVMTDFNHIVHELRTIELRHLPATDKVLLSAGCAGTWYFDWLERCAGPFQEHIGVELYSPRPADLPPNVRWIAQSASDMSAVPSQSVDVVFSGQNFEHLWEHDVVGFLLESHRVLRPGGVLVVDSPNRLLAEALHWSHPEHTIELTAGEAAALLDVAGFDVTVVRGLWNCRDERTGEWLPLDFQTPEEALRRCSTRRGVDDDFIWWIEATRTERPSDAEAVRALVHANFERHWNTRVNRVAVCTGTSSTDAGWCVDRGSSGMVYRTWGFPLFDGTYEARASDPRLRIRLSDPTGATINEGLSTVSGRIATTFGVIAELFADEPLPEDVVNVRVEVDQTPTQHAHDGATSAS